MIVRIDIDGTICNNTYGEYEEASPNHAMISRINKIYESGHTVVYWTDRGSTTNIDWTELTIKQLKDWNCKYHKLKLNKPEYDMYIDNKAISPKDFLKLSMNHLLEGDCI